MKVLILAALLCMYSAVTHAATHAVTDPAPVSNSTASSMVEGPLPAVETGLPVYPGQCPSGWFIKGSRCFLMVTSKKNWKDAAVHCVGQSGSLASVQSSEEYNFLQSMVILSGQSSAWIGGFYFQGAWLWIDSAGFHYTNWQTQNSVSRPCLHLNAIGGTSLAKSYGDQEVTVTSKDLIKCEHSKNYCVTDSSDCSSTHAVHRGLIADTVEDFKCYFIETAESLTCQWKLEKQEHAGETKSSLILSSIYEFEYCQHVLFFGTELNITLNMQNAVTRTEWLSGTYYAFLGDLVRAPRPVVLEAVTSQRSLTVIWTSDDTSTARCKLRHKPNGTDLWTEISVSTPEHRRNKMVYVIDRLQPVTLYAVSVSCVGQHGDWSDWSKECSGMTSESAPSSPPRVCYHVDDFCSPGTRKILLLWTALPAANAHGTILGYKVSYVPSEHPHLNRTVTTSSHRVTLEVMGAVYDIAVTAYNRAGESPAQRLQVTAGCQQYNVPSVPSVPSVRGLWVPSVPSVPSVRGLWVPSVPSVRGLWVYSTDGKLWVQWDTDTARPVSEFALERVAVAADPNHPEDPNDPKDPDDSHDSHWTWVEGSGRVPTALAGDIDPKQTYIVRVYPISGRECGPPSSLQANLESGALVAVVGLRVAMVTHQQAVVKWLWQRKRHQTNILQYSLELRSHRGNQSITVTPDMSECSFLSLWANTEYSVHLVARTSDGRTSIDKQDFTTLRRDPQEEAAETIMIVVPLLILVLATGVFSVTSRIVYRKHILLQVADPEQSVAGRWLMSTHVTGADQKVLQAEDLCVTEMQVEEKTCLTTEDNSRANREADVLNSKNETHERIDYEGINASLTFREGINASLTFGDHAEGPPTHSNAGYVHSITFPENSDCDKCVCAKEKMGDLDRTPRPSIVADVESIPFKANLDYIEGIPALA